jgi:hypothetical protein
VALTIAHPTIVPGFHRLFRSGVVDLPALLVGSLAPDIGEWTNRAALADRAHSWSGIVTTVLPIGLVMLFFYHLLRRPIFFALPNPHRQFVGESLALNRLALNPGGVASMVAGILLGSFCHLLWDAFTQVDGHFVQSISALRAALPLPHWCPVRGNIPLFVVLNLLTSALGFAVILYIYWGWCHTRRTHLPHPYAAREYDLWRWYFWAVAILVSAANGLPGALPLLSREPDLYRLSLFSNHWGTSFAVAFITFVSAGSVVIYLVWGYRSQKTQSEGEQ